MSVGYLFSGVITHLPILAVLVAGLIVVGTRKARLGPRSATLAQLGLGLLALGQVLEILWFMLLPEIISSMDYSSRNYGIMTLIVGILLAALVAAGLAFLLAALVTRAPAGPAGPFERAPAGPYEPAPAGPYEPAPAAYQPAPNSYGAPGSGFAPPAQASAPDGSWSSPGASGSDPGPPPSGPPAGR